MPSAEESRGDWVRSAMAVAGESAGQLFNWNLTEVSSPAVIAQARSVEDVQRVLLKNAEFPSPVSICLVFGRKRTSYP